MANDNAASTGGSVATATDGDGAAAVRAVRLPSGWEGLSFKLREGRRLFVAEVPKACFSSAAFAEKGAKPQVEGVLEGDEIATINGETPDRVIERITSSGDAWNACSSSKDAPHAVGSKGKFDSPPCPACDFIRRQKSLGLDVALQMWLRAVKREITITLGVRTGSGEMPPLLSTAAAVASSAPAPAGGEGGQEARSVVTIKDSSVSGSIGELKSLDELASEGRAARIKAGHLKDATGKGKGKGKSKGKGKGKDKGKKPRPSGPDLPRTRISVQPTTGEVAEWKGKYGWIVPAVPVDHPLAAKHKGRLYIHQNDLIYVDSLEPGMICRFQVFSDVSGIGAEECEVIKGADGMDYEEEGAWEEDGEWEADQDWEEGGQDRESGEDGGTWQAGAWQ